MVYQKLKSKESSIAIIGLGYVGLPLALELARHFKVIGFDIKQDRVDKMRQHIDPSHEIESKNFQGADIYFTSNLEDLKQCTFFIVAVPTPVDEHKVPDLKPLLSASEIIGKVLKKGDYVVYESTVYPGCTEEDCAPILEKNSGLVFGKDFKLGYSPERINPGDKSKTIRDILKIVSGSDEEALENISLVYGEIIHAGIYKASSIKVAEAAKVIENTQRDLNISFMNELAIIFDRMGIDTREVIEAAGTKWNFLKYYPGLVGGHCIGVDPYYLVHKAMELGYDPQVILSGRRINDGMPAFVAKKLIQILISKKKNPGDCKVLVMGITFKENVADIRNSKVADLYKELKAYSVKVDVIDPHADTLETWEEYQIQLLDKPTDQYDAVIVAVAHDEYKNKTEEYYTQFMGKDPILIDLKAVLSPKPKNIHYWRL
ncbi:MAG: nucleotide sugar dehydrogenase [Saprospiraceae bacterium]|nr:nucleotide sugar dehydrogenase [Saprospiraceae bacterium]